MFTVAGQVNVNLLVGSVPVEAGDIQPAQQTYVAEDIQNLELVSVLEKAGGELPVLTMQFRTRNEALVRSMNENSRIQLGLGSDDDTQDMASSSFIVQSGSLHRIGNEFWLVNAKAIKSTLIEWLRPHVEISDETSALQRIAAVAERAEGSNVYTNVPTSEDKQRWIQYGCPNRIHVNDIWLHTDMGTSFPLLANTLTDPGYEGGFRFYDATKKFGERIDWVLSTLDTDLAQGAIGYDFLAGVESVSGMFNTLGARGHDMRAYVLDHGLDVPLSSSPAPSLLPEGIADVSQAFAKVSNQRRPMSRNVHPRYWEAMIHNHTQLGLHSSSALSVTWRNRYHPIHPLDVVRFKDRNIDDDSQSAGYSGLYVVSRVAHGFDHNTYNCTVQLVREASHV